MRAREMMLLLCEPCRCQATSLPDPWPCTATPAWHSHLFELLVCDGVELAFSVYGSVSTMRQQVANRKRVSSRVSGVSTNQHRASIRSLERRWICLLSWQQSVRACGRETCNSLPTAICSPRVAFVESWMPRRCKYLSYCNSCFRPGKAGMPAWH